ncbi:hypothetical protein [Novipirellula herctigrandis]|uniref:hypothetical protein n=1 Tax=Novipirellula herctigrandis TaxID=2527986 RepID=UPI003AF3390D
MTSLIVTSLILNDVCEQLAFNGLLPGIAKSITIPSASELPELTISCDPLVPGQQRGSDAGFFCL